MRAKYCCASHKEAARVNRSRTERHCEHCGMLFRAATATRQRFCSTACATAHTVPTKVLQCVDCGESFIFRGRTTKHRCDRCWHKHRSDNVMALRHAKDPTVKVGAGSGGAQSVCSNTSQEHAIAKAKRREYYSRVTSNGSVPMDKGYRKRILTGDDKCYLCGYDRHQDALVVHHKNMDRTDGSVENLVVLCANCHAVIHKLYRRLIKTDTVCKDSIWDTAVKIMNGYESK